MNINYIIIAAACFFFAAFIAQAMLSNYHRRLQRLVSVSQDLKNHLTVIKWCTDLLLEQSGKLRISQLEFLRKILEANEESIYLLHSILGEDERTFSEEIQRQKSPPMGGLFVHEGKRN